MRTGLTIVVAVLVVALGHACMCPARSLCMKAMTADYLFKGVAVSVNSSMTSHQITFRVTKWLNSPYSGATENEIVVRTPLNEAGCGIRGQIVTGTEYAMSADSQKWSTSCGIIHVWSTLPPQDAQLLNGGGRCPICQTLKCGAQQNCVVVSDSSAYCADTCSSGRCPPDQTCKLEAVECIKAPCPPVARCVPTPVPTRSCLSMCSAIYQPLCGSDGITYSNNCTLSNAKCSNPGLAVSHPGVCCTKQCCKFKQCRPFATGEYCADVCHPQRCNNGLTCVLKPPPSCPQEPCPPIATCVNKCKKLDICPMYFRPSCANNGVTYGNDCLFQQAQCNNPNLAIIHDGVCDQNAASNCGQQLCPDIWQPVCGSDGKTYGNSCFFNLAQCKDQKLSIASEGICQCDKACPKSIAPVCSNQGVTYGNRCLLDVDACKNPNIWWQMDGECQKCQ